MLKKIRSFLKWLWWNLANIISIVRPIGIFIVFFLTEYILEVKLLLYFALLSTDKFDGWLAKRLKNTEGIGKLIDPVSDKADKFMFFVFLLISGILRSGILSETEIQLLFTGELIIVGIVAWGISLSMKHQKQIAKQKKEKGEEYHVYREMMAEILRKWKVDPMGKAVMGAYAVMVLILYLHAKGIDSYLVIKGFEGSEFTRILCVAVLGVGLSFRVCSIYAYFWRVYEYQKEVFR